MVATDLSVLFVASVFGKHHGFEQVVVRCGHLIGAGSMVIADGDRRLAAASAWIEIKDRDSVSRSGIASISPMRAATAWLCSEPCRGLFLEVFPLAE
jgi:hypothetical protein